MPFNPANDHLVFDGLQTVTITAKTNTQRGSDGVVSDTPVSHSIPNALKRQITLRQANNSVGKILIGDAFWEIAIAEVPVGFTIEKGMILIPDNAPTERWNILASDRATLDTRYRLHCRK